MTIGIDTSRAIVGARTGVEWYVYHLIRAIAALDQTTPIRLYTGGKGGAAFDNLPSNFEVRSLAWPFKLFWTQGALSREMLFSKPDVLFVPADALPFFLPEKSVTTIHDVGFLSYPKGYPAKRLAYLKWSTARAAAKADTIITVSEFSKQEIINHYGVPVERIRVIPHGFDRVQYIKRPLQEMESQWLLEKKITKPFILHVGRVDERKNLITLIEAFDLYRLSHDAQLVLAGPMGFGFEYILERIQKSPYREDIIHLGWIAEEEKVALLNSARAYALPSYYEGFGMPVLEAQSSELPLLCANTSSLPEVAGDGALFFDASSANDCVTNLDRVMNDETLRAELIDKGLNNTTRYSWEACAQETLEVIKHC